MYVWLYYKWNVYTVSFYGVKDSLLRTRIRCILKKALIICYITYIFRFVFFKIIFFIFIRRRMIRIRIYYVYPLVETLCKQKQSISCKIDLSANKKDNDQLRYPWKQIHPLWNTSSSPSWQQRQSTFFQTNNGIIKDIEIVQRNTLGQINWWFIGSLMLDILAFC